MECNNSEKIGILALGAAFGTVVTVGGLYVAHKLELIQVKINGLKMDKQEHASSNIDAAAVAEDEPCKTETENATEVETEPLEFNLPEDFFSLPQSRDESCFSDVCTLIKKVKADAGIFEAFVNTIAKDGNIDDDPATKYEFVYQLTGIRSMPHSQQEGERKATKIVWKGKPNNLLCIAKYLYEPMTGKYEKLSHCFEVEFKKQDKNELHPILPDNYSQYANKPDPKFKACLYRLYKIMMPQDKQRLQKNAQEYEAPSKNLTY